MNKSTARKILGLNGTEDERAIKRKYRKLMHEHHHDNSESEDSELAAKINTAYEMVMKDFDGSDGKHRSTQKKPTTKKSTKTKNWNAKENKNAYCARPILHEVEDYE